MTPIETVYLFLPILVYGFATLLLSLAKKLTFNVHLILTAVTVLGHLIINLTLFSFPESSLAIVQTVLSALFFVLAVFFLGGKVSHGAILAFTAIIGTVPLVNFMSAPGLVAGVLVFFGMVVYHMRAQKQSVVRFMRDEVVNTTGHLLSGAIGSMYDNVPDKKDVTDQIATQRKFSLIPTVLTIGIVCVIWNLVY